MRRVYFIAEWIRDDALSADGLASDRMHQKTVVEFEEAKAVAMSGALESPMYWAMVTKVEEINGEKDCGPRFVNEWINGDWTGWHELLNDGWG